MSTYPADDATTMDIILDGDGSLIDVGRLEDGRLKKVLRLPRGMQGGRSSVALLIRTADGRHILGQTSMRLFLTAAAAFIGAEKREHLIELGIKPPTTQSPGEKVAIEFMTDGMTKLRCADCAKEMGPTDE